MLPSHSENNVSTFLNSKEAAEIERLKKDDAVIGYILISPEGDEIESSSMPESSCAVFANVFDMAQGLGEELGEYEAQPLTILESATTEIFCINFASARAVILRRKAGKHTGGLRSVD